MKAVLFVVCLLFVSILHGQDTCLNNAMIKTSSMGNGKDSILFGLRFTVSKDSVTIKYGMEASHDVVLKVLSRTCNWNKDFQKGESIYNVEAMPEQKKAVLKIIINGDKRVIELLYEDSEPRIFNISNFSPQ